MFNINAYIYIYIYKLQEVKNPIVCLGTNESAYLEILDKMEEWKEEEWVKEVRR